MNREEFKREISKNLKEFAPKQTCLFAWRCAMRALPFLGYKGRLDFWGLEERQKYLYAVICAVDYRLYVDFNAPDAASATVASAAASGSRSTNGTAYAAAYTARSATYAVETVRYASAEARAAEARAVARFAEARAAARSAAARAAEFAANAAAAAEAYVSYVAAARSTTTNAAKADNDTYAQILDDLSQIKNNSTLTPIGTNQYGEIWNNFKAALKYEDCSYWARFFTGVFSIGIVDPKALERHRAVPKEIADQGAATVGHYLEASETHGARQFNEARIIILGDKGAGKTCLARKLRDPDASMTTDEESTAGVDTHLWKLEQENLNIHIWDFAGHTVTHAVHQFFLSERCVYIMVYDGRTEERNRLEYWLNHMKNYGGDSKAFILVNTRDGHPVDIPINKLREQYGIAGLFTMSLRDDKDKMNDFRAAIIDFVKNNPSWNSQKIPANYFKVKERLEAIFTAGDTHKNRELLCIDEFNKIAKENDIDDVPSLLTSLHALGISLWYSKISRYDTLILNPEWISHGVYKIINWASGRKCYDVALGDFGEIFSSDATRYPEDKHDFLFQLMQHYELAYIIHDNDKKRLIIPHLLNEDQPATLPDFPVGNSLQLQYCAEQPLPPNTISRFIVRHNQEIMCEMTGCGKSYFVWRFGVILSSVEGSIALVREEDRKITVSVKGGDKTACISRLRETLNAIFESYKSDRPEMCYRVVPNGELQEQLEQKHPLWLSAGKILNQAIRGIPYYEDITNRFIQLNLTVNNYDIKAENILNGVSAEALSIDSSRHVFDFHDCNISLQGTLKDLSQLVEEDGNSADAKTLRSAAKILEEAEQCTTGESVKKSGVANRLKRIIDEFSDETSTLNKTVKAIKGGVSIAQDIAKQYNNIAQWVGLPQVPTPFLKKG